MSLPELIRKDAVEDKVERCVGGRHKVEDVVDDADVVVVSGGRKRLRNGTLLHWVFH